VTVRAPESVRQLLSFAVRVDDHFSGAPWPDVLDVRLDTFEPPVPVQGGGRNDIRHTDGTYRWANLPAGPRTLTVASRDGSGFTWTATTPVVLPLVNPAAPIVVEMWPTPQARIAAGTVVIRGRLFTAVAGQEVRMEVDGVAPRNRFTRVGHDGEFTFVVVGPMDLDTDSNVVLIVTVPGRVVASIQIRDGNTNPTVAGNTFAVAPGRETRAYINLT
jgi:hypothetical protein